MIMMKTVTKGMKMVSKGRHKGMGNAQYGVQYVQFGVVWGVIFVWHYYVKCDILA